MLQRERLAKVSESLKHDKLSWPQFVQRVASQVQFGVGGVKFAKDPRLVNRDPWLQQKVDVFRAELLEQVLRGEKDPQVSNPFDQNKGMLNMFSF